MNIFVVSASRYGSATQGAWWIAERLSIAGHQATLFQAEDAPAPDDADLIVLGSGIYAHKLLPAVNAYIDRHLAVLCRKKLAVFALAMRTNPVFVRGQVHGGLAHLEYLFPKLGAALVYADMLPGQMVYSRLSAADAASLDRFYAMIGLSAEEIEKRKAPRTLMNKADYWHFAEQVLQKVAEES